MTFSSAMPIMYGAGCLLFFAMYWSDKILFLRHYKKPPKYGLELASRGLKILEWSIPVHFFFGLFMLTNPEIFNAEGEKGTSINFLPSLRRGSGEFMNFWFGMREDRFNTSHGTAYLIGVFFFMIFFLLEQFLGICTRLNGAVCQVMKHRVEESKGFISNNIFKHIAAEDLTFAYTDAMR